ncbi:hypothetical protein [Synechococcus sp. WH 8016]|nr:hypothetical protein [Synechococcus sp. WH 8016]
MTGESEWLTGCPNSATSAVVPLIIPLFVRPDQPAVRAVREPHLASW